MIPSKTSNPTYETSADLIADFPFEELGIDISEDNVYPISYESDGSGGNYVDQ